MLTVGVAVGPPPPGEIVIVVIARPTFPAPSTAASTIVTGVDAVTVGAVKLVVGPEIDDSATVGPADCAQDKDSVPVPPWEPLPSSVTIVPDPAVVGPLITATGPFPPGVTVTVVDAPAEFFPFVTVTWNVSTVLDDTAGAV